jgi:hypothetical protein
MGGNRKQIEYEEPKLVKLSDFDDLADGLVQCRAGSAADGHCLSGGLATGQCNPTGGSGS